ncbi:hypothetical protein ACHWQZ_G005294 [Mnemiopsis leidyi]
MLQFIGTIIESVQVARFQWRIHFLNLLVGLVGSSRTFLDVLFSKQPDWWCEDGFVDCQNQRDISKYFIPCRNGSILDGVQLENKSENYFLVFFKLLCKDDHFGLNLPMASSSFFIGALIGGCLLGIISDTRGRRFAVLASLIAAFLSSLLIVFTPIIEIYILGRFLDGICFGGYWINTFVISIEYSRPDRRSWCILSYFVLWGPAMVLMLYLGELLSQHTSALILFLLIMTACLGIESAAWTFGNSAKHDKKKSSDLVKSIAKIIKMEVTNVPNERFHRSQSTQSFQDVLRGSRYRKYRQSILSLLYIWFITAVAYYLSYYEAFFKQSPKELGVPVSSLVLLSAGSNLTGFLLSTLLARCLPRRTSLIITTLAAAASSFGLIAPNKYSDFVLLLVGKIVTSGLFSLVYLVTVEIVPTPSRGFVVGICFGMSRLAATLAPHINYIADILDALPQVFVGTALLVCSIASWTLPETGETELLQDYYQTKDLQRHLEKYKTRHLSKSLESSI